MAAFTPALETSAYAGYCQAVPAIYARAQFADGGRLPSFGSVGTGGIENGNFVVFRHGYNPYEILIVDTKEQSATYTPTELMAVVKAGFGRTLSHLPAVFGVSRQTLYNWMAGEIPKEQHQAKLVQLAEAGKVFSKAGVKPTAMMLERTVANGKSLVELLSEGADGREVAQKLIRIVQRGSAARSKIDALLGDRKTPRLEISDMGRQSFPDEA